MFSIGRHKESLSIHAQLMQMFSFEDQELSVNRTGSLSEKQQKRLASESKGWAKGGLAAGLYVLTAFLSSITNSSPGISFMLGTVIIGAVIITFCILTSVRLKEDVAHNVVLSITGTVTFEMLGKSSQMVIRAQETTIYFSLGLYRRKRFDLVEPYMYTLYYLPRSKRIVSAEHTPSRSAQADGLIIK